MRGRSTCRVSVLSVLRSGESSITHHFSTIRTGCSTSFMTSASLNATLWYSRLLLIENQGQRPTFRHSSTIKVTQDDSTTWFCGFFGM